MDSTSGISDDLKQENIKLQNEISQCKHTIKTLQEDINKMKPFVELTKTIKENSPKTWEYYASKTITKHKC